MLPFALQHEGAQAVRIIAIGVDRLDGGEEGAVREAVAKGEPAFRGIGDVILAQVGDGVGERAVEIEAALVGEREDHRRGGDDLRDRGEVEPVILGQRFRLRYQGGVADQPDRAAAIGGDDAKGGAGEAAFGDIAGGGREGAVDIDHASSGRGFAPAMRGRNTTAARLRLPDSQKKPS